MLVLSRKALRNEIIKTEFCVVAVVPTLTLVLGSNLNPMDIEEGDDVYFDCNVEANPAAYKIVWKHNVSPVRPHFSDSVPFLPIQPILPLHPLLLVHIYTCNSEIISLWLTGGNEWVSCIPSYSIPLPASIIIKIIIHIRRSINMHIENEFTESSGTTPVLVRSPAAEFHTCRNFIAKWKFSSLLLCFLLLGGESGSFEFRCPHRIASPHVCCFRARPCSTTTRQVS